MPDLGNAPALYPARPRLLVDGQEQPSLSDALLELVVEETCAGLFRCEATFLNWGPKDGSVGYQYFDREIFDFGKTFAVETGAGDASGRVFSGRIMAIEGRFPRQRPPELLILAEDRLQDLRMTRRTRTFEDVSDADLFRQVASQHGLRADVDVNGPTHRVLAQLNQSDLAFLRERARAVDAELWVDSDTLKVKARARRQSGDVRLTFGQGLHEFSVMADLAGQASGFSVSGWDVSAKDALRYRASDSALAGELDGDVGGSRILGDAIGERDQQIVHALPVSSQEAQALAEAHYRRTARRFVVGVGSAEGDARLRAGSKLELQGLGTLFDGKYYVVRSQHMFEVARGYRTQFTVERPGIGN